MEVKFANSVRNLAGGRNFRSAGNRHTAGDLPRMQPHQAKQNRPVLERHVQIGRSGLALLALLICGGQVLR